MSNNPYESPVEPSSSSPDQLPSFGEFRLLGELVVYFLAAGWFTILSEGLVIGSDSVQLSLRTKVGVTAATAAIGGAALACLILRAKAPPSRARIANLIVGLPAVLWFLFISSLQIFVMW